MGVVEFFHALPDVKAAATDFLTNEDGLETWIVVVFSLEYFVQSIVKSRLNFRFVAELVCILHETQVALIELLFLFQEVKRVLFSVIFTSRLLLELILKDYFASNTQVIS